MRMLLAELFGDVIIPPAVESELRGFHSVLPDYLKRVPPRNEALLLRLASQLDAGEAEAICVACELHADRLLIDEKKGRIAALEEGLRIIGVVGVLVLAKQRGMLPSIGALLTKLEVEASFRLSSQVKVAALLAVGESVG
jgi:predicted nucleic acid-binding protein